MLVRLVKGYRRTEIILTTKSAHGKLNGLIPATRRLASFRLCAQASDRSANSCITTIERVMILQKIEIDAGSTLHENPVVRQNSM